MTGNPADDVALDATIRANPAMRGREAYEASVAARPFYHDGTPRKAWEALDDVARWSWSRPARCAR